MANANITDFMVAKRQRTAEAPAPSLTVSTQQEEVDVPEEGQVSEMKSSMTQLTLPFAPLKKLRRRTTEEIEKIIPMSQWNDTQCEEGCDCYFCKIYWGYVEDVSFVAEEPKSEKDNS